MELQEQINSLLNKWAEIAVKERESVSLLHSVYTELFGTQIKQDCGSCYQKAFQRIQKFVYLNSEKLKSKSISNLKNEVMATAMKNRKYLLKDGVQIQDGFGGEYLTNDNLTDETAARLLSATPELATNFSRIPPEEAPEESITHNTPLGKAEKAAKTASAKTSTKTTLARRGRKANAEKQAETQTALTAEIASADNAEANDLPHETVDAPYLTPEGEGTEQGDNKGE